MSFVERISLSGDFNDLIARNENQREFRDANVVNTENIAGQTESIAPTTVASEDRLAVDNNILPELQNTDGDRAEISESGMQLAQNVTMNEPLALE